MKARLPLFVMLGSSVAFLASLYLTWVSAGDPSKPLQIHSGALDLLDMVNNALALNGWGAFGQAAALAAVALGLLALVSFFRPQLEATLPIGGCAFALAVLTLVSIADLRAQGIYEAGNERLTAHLSTGAYVGAAAALAALLSAAWVSYDEIPSLGTAVAATLLTGGLVAAYVLPTLSVHTRLGSVEFVEVGRYGTAIMLLIASFGLTFWFGAGPPALKRIAAATVVLVLAIGGASALGTHAFWPNEAWLAIGCAAGLLALAVATNGPLRASWLTRRDAIALGGSALFFASLFFNWVQSCQAPPHGACFVGNGWGGGLTGGLVAILVVVHLGFRRLLPELAVTVAIFVVTLALSITVEGSLRYGAYLGFASTALLLLAVCLLPRPPFRVGFHLIGVVACLAFLVIPVATLSGRAPYNVELFGKWALFLLEAAAIVVALRLAGSWLKGATADLELLLLPVALLVLTGLDLGEKFQDRSIGWEGLLSLALAAFLVVLGWLAQRGRLENFRVPEEIWRVDRISTGEN